MRKVSLLVCLAAALVFTGCGDDENPLISKTITSADGLTIEMTWTINDEEVGYEFVDVDVVLDDLAQGTGVDGYENSSGSGFGFEDMFMEDTYADGTYLLAPFIYNFEVADEAIVNSEDIVLTFKIYAGVDDSEAKTFTQKFTYENISLDPNAFAKYSITKTGDTYKIKELSKIKEINSGWTD